jgi:hypothetical protein
MPDGPSGAARHWLSAWHRGGAVSVAARFAAHALGASFDDLPPETVAHAKQTV